MSEKGGKAKEYEESVIEKIMHVMIVAGGWAVLVFLVISFTLGAVIVGARIQGNYNRYQYFSAEEVELSYKLSGYSYTYNRENQNSDVSSQLLNEFSGSHSNYVVIKSKSRYDALVKLARERSMIDVASAEISEDFFKSGTVIAVTSENTDLASAEVARVYRDESNEVYVDLDIKESDIALSSNDYIYGQIYFIKLENVQPKNVTVFSKIVDSEKE